jgi:hypothetical protein
MCGSDGRPNIMSEQMRDMYILNYYRNLGIPLTEKAKQDLREQISLSMYEPEVREVVFKYIREHEGKMV